MEIRILCLGGRASRDVVDWSDVEMRRSEEKDFVIATVLVAVELRVMPARSEVTDIYRSKRFNYGRKWCAKEKKKIQRRKTFY